MVTMRIHRFPVPENLPSVLDSHSQSHQYSSEVILFSLTVENIVSSIIEPIGPHTNVLVVPWSPGLGPAGFGRRTNEAAPHAAGKNGRAR